MQPHEYSVIGHSRATWGRYLGAGAAAIASISSAVAVAVFEVAQAFGLGQTTQVILWPLTAAAIFPAAHFAFDRWVWRWNRISTLLKIPDLNGDWVCAGTTMDRTPHIEWQGTITIEQTWEKITVCFRGAQSSSHSISAALVHEPGAGCRLMYSYRNAPRIGEPELAAHIGYAELVFGANLAVAEGDYFNNQGRTTFGRMRLTRVSANG